MKYSYYKHEKVRFMAKDYWKKRFDQIEQAANDKSVRYYRAMERKYEKAMRNVEKKIAVWYQRFATNNNITVDQARKLLNAKELTELKWDVFDYIKYGEENAIDAKWMKELENASAKFHISRLEALKLQCRQEIEVLTGGMVDDVDGLLRDVYTDTYYHSIFEIQKGFRTMRKPLKNQITTKSFAETSIPLTSTTDGL